MQNKNKKVQTGHVHHIFLPMALTPHPAHPTKKTGGETNQNQQKALTTFTENDTMVHYKTKGGAICVQRVLLISR